jgi:hypothetical protein
VRVRSRRRTASRGQACHIHAWVCPVIMKTDPDRVAWTCGRCGTICTKGIGERPSLALDEAAGAASPAHASAPSTAANTPQ